MIGHRLTSQGTIENLVKEFPLYNQNYPRRWKSSVKHSSKYIIYKIFNILNFWSYLRLLSIICLWYFRINVIVLKHKYFTKCTVKSRHPTEFESKMWINQVKENLSLKSLYCNKFNYLVELFFLYYVAAKTEIGQF